MSGSSGFYDQFAPRLITASSLNAVSCIDERSPGGRAAHRSHLDLVAQRPFPSMPPIHESTAKCGAITPPF